jgi:hypothetical protein
MALPTFWFILKYTAYHYILLKWKIFHIPFSKTVLLLCLFATVGRRRGRETILLIGRILLVQTTIRAVWVEQLYTNA